MRPSSIGYLHYDGTDEWIPIIDVQLVSGKIMFTGLTYAPERGTLSIDEGAACTIIGVDGGQIMWVPHSGISVVKTAANGGTVTVFQPLTIRDVDPERDDS